MKQGFFAAVTAALVFAGGSALAADLPAKAPAYKAPIYDNWSGFYFGGHAGYRWGNADFFDTVQQGGGSYSVNGFIGGGQLGYRWQSWGNPIVLGVEGDFSGTSAKGNDGGFGGLVDETKIRWTGSVRGILGFSMGKALVYGTGGIAWAGVRTRDVGGPWESHTFNGWTAGGGIDYALTPSWTVGVLYRYSNYGDEQVNTIPGTLELASHQVVGRLNYRFG